MKIIRHMNVVKAFGICGIVLGHSFSESSSSVVRSFLYLYHVPLFFFISGYFFNEKSLEDFWSLIKKRLKTLYWPYISYGIIFLLLHNVFLKIDLYSTKIGFRDTVSSAYGIGGFVKNGLKIFAFNHTEQLLGGFWFLEALFYSIVIFAAISWFVNHRFKKHKEVFRFIFLASAFIIGNLLYKTGLRLPGGLQLASITAFIYYIGYLYRQYEKYIPMKWYYSVISFIVLVLIVKLNIVKIDSISSVTGSLSLSAFFLIFTPLFGIYLNIYLSLYIAKTSSTKFFEYIGQNTIVILAWHFLCFKLVSLIIIYYYGYPMYMLASFPVIKGESWWYICYFIAGVLMPLLISYLFFTSLRYVREKFIFPSRC
jgi:fucose 4-O-acetylase-like acetyltransferase